MLASSFIYHRYIELSTTFTSKGLSRDMTIQQNECAPSEDSDQPGHPPSLIRVFAVRSVGSQGPKLSSCGQRRCPGCSEFAGSTLTLLVLSYRGSGDVNIAKVAVVSCNNDGTAPEPGYILAKSSNRPLLKFR